MTLLHTKLGRLIQIVSLSIFCFFLISSCDRDDYSSNKFNIGYTPIYMDSINFIYQFKTVDAKPDFDTNLLSNQGMYKGHYLVLEKDSGINIIDITTKESVGYIKAPLIKGSKINGNEIICSLTIADIYLGTDNFPQIEYQGLKFRDTAEGWANLQDIKEQEDQVNFRITQDKVFFECPKRENGFVVKWEALNAEKLKCYKIF